MKFYFRTKVHLQLFGIVYFLTVADVGYCLKQAFVTLRILPQ